MQSNYREGDVPGCCPSPEAELSIPGVPQHKLHCGCLPTVPHPQHRSLESHPFFRRCHPRLFFLSLMMYIRIQRAFSALGYVSFEVVHRGAPQSTGYGHSSAAVAQPPCLFLCSCTPKCPQGAPKASPSCPQAAPHGVPAALGPLSIRNPRCNGLAQESQLLTGVSRAV